MNKKWSLALLISTLLPLTSLISMIFVKHILFSIPLETWTYIGFRIIAGYIFVILIRIGLVASLCMTIVHIIKSRREGCVVVITLTVLSNLCALATFLMFTFSHMDYSILFGPHGAGSLISRVYADPRVIATMLIHVIAFYGLCFYIWLIIKEDRKV